MPNILGSKWNNTTYFGIKMTQYHILGFIWNQTVWNQNASHNSLQIGRIIVLFCSKVSNLKSLSKIYPRNGFWGPDKLKKNTNAFFCGCKPNNPGPPVFFITDERETFREWFSYVLLARKSRYIDVIARQNRSQSFYAQKYINIQIHIWCVIGLSTTYNEEKKVWRLK